MRTRTYHRIGLVSGNALRQIIVSGFNMAVPFLVLSNSSKVVWGAFVSPLLYTFLALQVISWGNKEYLMRAFSEMPRKIKPAYASTLLTRFPIVIIFSLVSLIFYPAGLSAYLAIWLFGRYLAQSAEALVIFEKRFNAAVIIETLSFTVFAISLYWRKGNLDMPALTALYGFYQLVRGIGFSLMFRPLFQLKDFTWNPEYFIAAFPFFLLSAMGFLASKIDVYIIEHLGNKVLTSDYQVMNSMLVFIMSVSALIYTPFTKNLYRNASPTLERTKQLLAIAGIAISAGGILFVWMALTFYLHRAESAFLYVAAFAYVIPTFFYGIDVVQLFRNRKEKVVVIYLVAGIVVNALLSALFLYLGYGLTGCLSGSAIAQWLVLLLLKLPDFEK